MKMRDDLLVWDKLYQRGLITAARQQINHQQSLHDLELDKSNNELMECTFHPTVNSQQPRPHPEISIFEKLSRDAFYVEQKRVLAQKQKEIAEEKKLTLAIAAARPPKQLHSDAASMTPPKTHSDPAHCEYLYRQAGMKKKSVSGVKSECSFQPNIKSVQGKTRNEVHLHRMCDKARARMAQRHVDNAKMFEQQLTINLFIAEQGREKLRRNGRTCLSGAADCTCERHRHPPRLPKTPRKPHTQSSKMMGGAGVVASPDFLSLQALISGEF